jgi:hypothetical protein
MSQKALEEFQDYGQCLQNVCQNGKIGTPHFAWKCLLHSRRKGYAECIAVPWQAVPLLQRPHHTRTHSTPWAAAARGSILLFSVPARVGKRRHTGEGSPGWTAQWQQRPRRPSPCCGGTGSVASLCPCEPTPAMNIVNQPHQGATSATGSFCK